MLPMNRSVMVFARGARTGVLITWVPAAGKRASDVVVNLASRSRMRNRMVLPASSRSIGRLRAGWVSQALVGWVVTPGMCTRRVACSTTKNG